MEIAINPHIQERLKELLHTMILPEGTHFEIEHQWAGIMAFGEEKIPIVRNLGNGLVMGVRMNGMGIAIGSEIGAKVAGMLG
jgi:hypothetical protein